MTDRLLEELQCETVIKIPFLNGLLDIKESIVVTWIIMAVIVALCIIFVRNLKVENPGKGQLLLESAISTGQNFFEDVMGKENRKYIPYLLTVLIYIGISNIIGLFGFKPPTKDLNVTAAIAIMSMILIEYSGIHKNGNGCTRTPPLSRRRKGRGGGIAEWYCQPLPGH